jgi:hypothetical protein
LVDRLSTCSLEGFAHTFAHHQHSALKEKENSFIFKHFLFGCELKIAEESNFPTQFSFSPMKFEEFSVRRKL